MTTSRTGGAGKGKERDGKATEYSESEDEPSDSGGSMIVNAPQAGVQAGKPWLRGEGLTDETSEDVDILARGIKGFVDASRVGLHGFVAQTVEIGDELFEGKLLQEVRFPQEITGTLVADKFVSRDQEGFYLGQRTKAMVNQYLAGRAKPRTPHTKAEQVVVSEPLLSEGYGGTHREREATEPTIASHESDSIEPFEQLSDLRFRAKIDESWLDAAVLPYSIRTENWVKVLYKGVPIGRFHRKRKAAAVALSYQLSTFKVISIWHGDSEHPLEARESLPLLFPGSKKMERFTFVTDMGIDMKPSLGNFTASITATGLVTAPGSLFPRLRVDYTVRPRHKAVSNRRSTVPARSISTSVKLLRGSSLPRVNYSSLTTRT